MAWLGYLAVTTSRPEILSRPQFLGAEVDIIAELTGNADTPDGNATVTQVLWVAGEVKNPPEEGKPLKITNLSHVFPADGWTGPGFYLLPLTRGPLGQGFRIAPVLHSPGLARSQDRPRIYHATKAVRDQRQKLRE